jgi:putative transposase
MNPAIFSIPRVARNVSVAAGMVHPYTPFCSSFSYRGRYSYLLTFVTSERRRRFSDADEVEMVRAQFVRASREKAFEIVAYCFMPDHVHLIVLGLAEDSDLKAFAKLAKQYSGYRYAQSHDGQRLWQHGSNDHIIRDAVDLLDRLRYVVDNPVAAKLVEKPEDYPFLGSQRWLTPELVRRCRTGNLTGPASD